MAEYLKKATPPAPADVQAVRDTVTEILRARARGGPRRRARLLAPLRRLGPAVVQGRDEAEIAAARDKLAPEVLASLEFAHDAGQALRRAAARQHAGVRGGDAPGRLPRPEAHPGRQRRAPTCPAASTRC